MKVKDEEKNIKKVETQNKIVKTKHENTDNLAESKEEIKKDVKIETKQKELEKDVETEAKQKEIKKDAKIEKKQEDPEKNVETEKKQKELKKDAKKEHEKIEKENTTEFKPIENTEEAKIRCISNFWNIISNCNTISNCSLWNILNNDRKKHNNSKRSIHQKH